MFQSVRRWFFLVTDILACISLLAMLLLIFASVMFRYFFNQPLIFSDEYAGYLFLFTFMLGLLPTAADGSNIRVELFMHRLKGIGLKLFRGIDVTLIFAYAVLLLVITATFAMEAFQRGLRSESALQTPIYLPAIIMPIGLILLIVGYAVHLIKPDSKREGDGE